MYGKITTDINAALTKKLRNLAQLLGHSKDIKTNFETGGSQ